MSKVTFLVLITVSIVFAAKDESSKAGEYDDEDITCEPSIADSCFTDVSKDLRLLLQPKNGFQQAHNLTTLADLCSAWNDSLDCTAAIIDTDCTDENGRATFDRWNLAFSSGLRWLCQDGLVHIQEIFDSVHCFDLETFVDCVEKTENVVSIEDLMKTKIDYQKCSRIQDVLKDCGSYTVDNFQSELNDVHSDETCKNFLEPFHQLMDVIIKAAECERPAKANPKSASLGTSQLTLALEVKLFTLIMLLFKLYF